MIQSCAVTWVEKRDRVWKGAAYDRGDNGSKPESIPLLLARMIHAFEELWKLSNYLSFFLTFSTYILSAVVNLFAIFRLVKCSFSVNSKIYHHAITRSHFTNIFHIFQRIVCLPVVRPSCAYDTGTSK